MIDVVGGFYEEQILYPKYHGYFGSGGRAAIALRKMNENVRLHTYIGENTSDTITTISCLEKFEVERSLISKSIHFYYDHGLSEPKIYNKIDAYPEMKVDADNVVLFGMIENQAKVTCKNAVYDPQNVDDPKLFRANGSSAEKLAIITNKYELVKLCNGNVDDDVQLLAKQLQIEEKADVVVVKMGAKGALIVSDNKVEFIPAYRTNSVMKIGSGDIFTAHFAHHWLKERSASESALSASKAVAFYCDNRNMPYPEGLASFEAEKISVSDKYKDVHKPKVYLAGPFFNLAQIWQVEQALNGLLSMGLDVFSPYHAIGRGPAEQVVQKDIDAIEACDVLYAIGDGLDTGTVYEIGYARAIGKPVIIYAENQPEGDIKMMVGSDCDFYKDYVTSIYQTLWKAVTL